MSSFGGLDDRERRLMREQFASLKEDDLRAQPAAPCAGPTHFWTVAANATNPDDGQACECGDQTWPWHSALPRIDLRPESAA